MYEYLAAGKPVVSTRLPEVCANASELVYVGKDQKNFIRKVEEAVTESKGSEDKARILKRINFARNNSWEKRIDAVEKLLRHTLVSD